MQTASIITETKMTAVKIPDIPLIILNGMVMIPPINPTIVMILNKTKSIGRSGLKYFF